jgi:hypothetical protein
MWHHPFHFPSNLESDILKQTHDPPRQEDDRGDEDAPEDHLMESAVLPKKRPGDLGEGTQQKRTNQGTEYRPRPAHDGPQEDIDGDRTPKA